MKIISGIFKNRNIITPKGLEVRPSASRLRETLFNICQTYVEGARFLDLFSGSGAIGFEALSRGAKHVMFIEKSREAVQYIQKNANNFDVDNQVSILSGDVFELLERLTERNFDIIFADPPYHTDTINLPSYGEKILKEIDRRSLLATDGVFFLEESANAHLEAVQLHHLSLKSKRRMGRSLLFEYKLKFSTDV